MAFLDRLVERAIILKVTGKSYRAWLAQQATEVEASKSVEVKELLAVSPIFHPCRRPERNPHSGPF
jgi:hypothetical protein